MARAARRRATSPTRRSAPTPKAPPGGLSPAQLLFVAKALGNEAKKWRDVVKPRSDQKFDVALRVAGLFDVEPNGRHYPKQAPDSDELLALVYSELDELGLAEERAKIHKRVLAKFKQGRRPDVDAEYKRLAKIAVEAVTTSTRKRKRGDVHAREVLLTKLPRDS